ncbi:hypothetical protein C8F04DRAFT_42384 [Mycena alexandri]|uniref:Uncharacterized protein n=1 Tax=Mycena alexandri TaxID=1745969 RepID=A0AAD6WXX7_9AGAR|nr:hypothetical protein C8F04DRAFT_42384 [Mycena alexandri]
MQHWKSRHAICELSVLAMLRVLQERAAQWQNIRLWFDWDERHRCCKNTFPVDGNYPSLTKLAIGGAQSLRALDFRDFHGADTIRELDLQDFTRAEFGLLTASQWANLTAFSATSIDLNHCVDLLRSTPNLTRCAFHVDTARTNSPILLVTSTLRSLTLSENVPHETACPPVDLLQHLTLPHLQRLRLDFKKPHFGRRAPTPGFASSAAQLDELSLHNAPFAAGTLLHCLASTPCVVALHLGPAAGDGGWGRAVGSDQPNGLIDSHPEGMCVSVRAAGEIGAAPQAFLCACGATEACWVGDVSCLLNARAVPPFERPLGRDGCDEGVGDMG